MVLGGKRGGVKRRHREDVLQVSPLMTIIVEQPNHHLLPEDIIDDEILTRLPVKSLLKFRCVCKSWLSLISSSRFIKSHLLKSSNSIGYVNHRALPQNSFNTYYAYPYNSITYDPTSSLNPIKHIDIPTSLPIDRLLVNPIGSCNGLLCVSFLSNTYTIFNPSLKKLHKLPLPGRLTGHIFTDGFGYDEVNDDYKVFIIIGNIVGNCVEYTEAKIYSLKNNCWRNIKTHPLWSSYYCTYGVLVSGKLHWATWPTCSVTFNEFFSLDMVTEEFSTVAYPKHGYGDGESVEWCLVESRGRLYSFGDHNKICMDIWEMKDYGVEKESWTKFGSILFSTTTIGNWPLFPFFVTENGDVLLHAKKSVILYSLKYSKILGCKLYGGSHLTTICNYKESLVPPYFDGGEDYTTLGNSLAPTYVDGGVSQVAGSLQRISVRWSIIVGVFTLMFVFVAVVALFEIIR